MKLRGTITTSPVGVRCILLLYQRSSLSCRYVMIEGNAEGAKNDEMSVKIFAVITTFFRVNARERIQSQHTIPRRK